jgi:hypothetical protein
MVLKADDAGNAELDAAWFSIGTLHSKEESNQSSDSQNSSPFLSGETTL